MTGYGQYCPVAKGAEVFAERWTPLVVRELLGGSRHFNEIHRGVPQMSRTLLSQRLKRLEEIKVVERRRGARGSEYHLTEAGREFAPLVRLLGEWGHRWFRSSFGPDEIDAGLLFWEMRRTVKPDTFPPGRVTVQFAFLDQPASRRNWWIVSDGEHVDLCPSDPAFEVDLFVTTDLKSFTRIWMGDLGVKSALAAGKLELHGSRVLRHRFEQWLGLSCFAGIKTCDRAA